MSPPRHSRGTCAITPAGYTPRRATASASSLTSVARIDTAPGWAAIPHSTSASVYGSSPVAQPALHARNRRPPRARHAGTTTSINAWTCDRCRKNRVSPTRTASTSAPSSPRPCGALTRPR